MFKNWKTTLFGFLAAFVHVAVNGVTFKQLIMAGLLAGLGALAKDHSN